MRGDRVDAVRRRVGTGFGRFGGRCGHRGRVGPGVRACLGAGHFGAGHFGAGRAYTCPEATCQNVLGARDEFPRFRGSRELYGARRLR